MKWQIQLHTIETIKTFVLSNQSALYYVDELNDTTDEFLQKEGCPTYGTDDLTGIFSCFKLDKPYSCYVAVIFTFYLVAVTLNLLVKKIKCRFISIHVYIGIILGLEHKYCMYFFYLLFT